MAALRKFAFDTDFDADTPEPPEAAQAPVEPSYSAAELAEACERAFAEGRAAGQSAERAATEHAVAEALRHVGQQMGTLLKGQEESDRRNATAATATAVAILRKLHPELARRNGLTEVESVLAHCLESMRPEPRIVIRVHDDMLDPLRERLETIAAAAAYEGRIVILADGAIALGDCRVEWADGGLERDTDRLWKDIEAALNRNAAASSEQA